MISYPFAPTALDADGICAAQQLVGAGDLLIDGDLAVSGVVTLGEQARVTLYSAADLSLITFTVYGTTKHGISISEEIAGPTAGATVTTTANFKTITEVAADAAVGSDVTVGNSDTLETGWVALNGYSPLKGISVQLGSTANLTYEVQYATSSVQTGDDTGVLALADGVLTGKTTSAGLVAAIPWFAMRLAITSFVAGGGTLRVTESPG